MSRDWETFYGNSSDELIFSCLKHKQLHFQMLSDNLSPYIKGKSQANYLDFGCGKAEYLFMNDDFNLINVFLYDKSNEVLETVPERKFIKKINFLDLKNKNNFFDLIVISSVVQYMSHDEFESTLNILLKSLKLDGKLILIDVPKNISILKEVIENFRNSIVNFYFLSYLYFFLKKLFKTYNSLYRHNPLTRYSKSFINNFCIHNTLNLNIANNFILNKKRATYILTKSRS